MEKTRKVGERHKIVKRRLGSARERESSTQISCENDSHLHHLRRNAEGENSKGRDWIRAWDKLCIDEFRHAWTVESIHIYVLPRSKLMDHASSDIFADIDAYTRFPSVVLNSYGYYISITIPKQ